MFMTQNASVETAVAARTYNTERNDFMLGAGGGYFASGDG